MKQLLINFIKKWEGGFANDPDDAGGATMAGITFATFKQYRRDMRLPAPTVNDLKKISDAEWEAIFTRYYWDGVKADSISNKRNACCLVSWAWGSGVATAIKLFQRNFGLVADGAVGAKTLAAIEAASFDKLVEVRADFFRDICARKPSQKKFLRGWLNRLADFKRTFG
jgi:lysozyme family protein